MSRRTAQSEYNDKVIVVLESLQKQLQLISNWNDELSYAVRELNRRLSELESRG